jgi:hypothetical protein
MEEVLVGTGYVRAADNTPLRSVPVLDEGVPLVLVEDLVIPYCPYIIRRKCGNSRKSAGVRTRLIWTGNYRPLTSIPVLSERLALQATDVPNGPYVCAVDLCNSSECAPAIARSASSGGAGIGAGNDAPRRAVPMFN